MRRLAILALAVACFGCQVLDREINLGQSENVDEDSVGDNGTGSADLALAADYLEKGNESAACDYLARHIAAHPNQVSLRVQYAELLFNQKRWPEARDEFERFAAVAQERGAPLLPFRIHAHSRLMELAETREDEYELHLQRGIGLYCLAQKQLAEKEPDDELSVEGLHFKAATEMARAHELRPLQARPCWYLYLTWRSLGQHQRAQHWLDETNDRSHDSFLTLGEQRHLHLACQAFQR